MKETQNYGNHAKFYTAHHFIFYPVILILIALSIYYGQQNPQQRTLYFLLCTAFFTIGWLAFMLRQHYALGNQNRIVRLETRLRYFEITGKSFSDIETRLTFEQLAALRFASDSEFLELLQLALDKHLSSTEIKKAIKVWMPDDMRV